MTERNALVAKLRDNNATPTQEMTLKRWVAWTPQAAERRWPEGGRDNRQWLDRFTLEDAREYSRLNWRAGVRSI
jgi:hypothetical protein